MAATQFTGKNIKDSSVDLALDVFGSLPVANGGTGATTAAGARGNLFLGCRLEQLTTQNTVNNADYVFPFTVETFDNSNFHSTSVNTSRLTAPVTGWYLIGASVQWNSSSVGRRQMIIKANGVLEIEVVSQMPITTAATVTQQAVPPVMYPLTAGEYVELIVSQSSGGALGAVARHFTIVLL